MMFVSRHFSTTLEQVNMIVFGIGLCCWGAVAMSISRALAPGTGAIAALSGEHPVISEADARGVRRVYIGTTSLSIFFSNMNGSCSSSCLASST